MSYRPIPGPRPGKQWRPSNGSEAEALFDVCSTCARDAAMREGLPLEECDDNELCEIIAAFYRGEAEELRLVDGDIKCMAYVPHGEPVPTRCERTVDMFSERTE